MRSFGAAALFIIAVATDCLGAQERSRQRSGPIRSVPLAADLKRDVDFDCPEEFGYYPHPTDCSLYYVCVFGGALLESCTGGLMYSHELQTCDWPRNVGCDGTSGSAVSEDIERLSDREPSPPPPPPPPPRRTPSAPPSLPRVQPNPVVTSRGQPKFNREDYEKQQQLYAEVDDLPPVEEIESDRQQRVYRGQPSTIGQVQKDRDGYGSQVINSRTLNSNIIPASIPQSVGKIGSFSFGTQVEDRRAPTATPAPLSYSDGKIDKVTDSSHDRHADIRTKEIVKSGANKRSLSRHKREAKEITSPKDDDNSTSKDEVSDRSDIDEVMEYFESDGDEDDHHDEILEDTANLEDTERGKRQIRYILKNNYKNPGKVWANSKPIKFVDNQPYNHNSNSQSNRYQSTNTGATKNNYYDVTRRPYDNNFYSSANPFVSYHNDNYQSQRPFVPSLPDLFDQRSPQHNPMNVATQIITKSPPISALKNNENPFSALAGGFFNNIPTQSNSQYKQNVNQLTYQTSSAINNYQPSQDSSLLPSTVVTGKPIKMATSSQQRPKYRVHPVQNSNNNNQAQNAYRNPTQKHQPNKNRDINRPSYNEEEYDNDEEEDEDSEEEDDDNSSNEKDEQDNFYKHSFPKPPYEFTNPRYKYADIENPFADPNFDFDAFLSKLRNDYDKAVLSTTANPKAVQRQNIAVKIINPTTESNDNSGLRSSTLSYNGMSTPRPFTNPTAPNGVTIPIQDNVNTLPTTKQPEKFQKLVHLPNSNQQSFIQNHSKDANTYNRFVQQSSGIPIDAVRPKLKPPNFNDDRQLPISYSFNRPISSSANPSYDKTKEEDKQVFTATRKPFIFITSTGTPMILTSPKQQFYVKPEKIITLQPQMVTGKQYFTISSERPYNGYITIQQSTERPLTTKANEQLSILQQFWKNLSTVPPLPIKSSMTPNSISEMPNLESLFEQAIRSTLKTPTKQVVTTTTTVKPSGNRRPIPKPSPEMNDYYYEDDEELYEPPVKSQYMPSTEVKPQRPPMAQNYKEYDEDTDYEESPVNNKPISNSNSIPAYYRPETVTKNHNDVSVVTKAPAKGSNRYKHGKQGVPIMLNYVTPAPNVLMRPEVTNYMIHHAHRNKTMFIRRPTASGSGPYTIKPPKYLNQTTLRPYTVRHRLAKPTIVTVSSTESGEKTTRGRVRHQNIVAQMKLTTPRDSHNQETRYTKTRHDDKSNSLEPTESVTPPSYSANPRPKMLYNGTQSYTPDQYDPYYAVYDEDGELYKDTDYVQQYNTASLRPAVQQTYRGTPPPARRPVEVYTPRPTQEDYDDALIHGQINNQNQYQSAIRHSTRGEGNELGYEHNPSSVKTTVYEAPTISTTPTATSTSTTTERPTSAPITEAMTPSRFTQRSSTDENPNDLPESSSKSPSDGFAFSFPATSSPTINFSSLAKPFEQTDNLNRLKDTLPTTERFLNSRLPARVTNINKPVEVVRMTSDEIKRRAHHTSLTTGFSIRRNSNNTNNPYTLTVLTRPFESYNQSWKVDNSDFNNEKRIIPNTFYSNDDIKEGQEQPVQFKGDDILMDRHSSESSMRRSDSSPEKVSEGDIKPLYVRPSSTNQKVKTKITMTPTPVTTATKYYLKTVIKRPAPFSANDESHEDSTENVINTEELIEAGLQNARANEKSNIQYNDSTKTEFTKRVLSDEADQFPIRSSYRSLDGYNNYYSNQQNDFSDITSSTTTTKIPTFAPRETVRSNKKNDKTRTLKPTYFSYRVLDDEMPDHTTEIFSTSVKNIIKAFFNNFASSPNPLSVQTSTLPFRTTTEPEEKTVNIGFQKRPVTYVDEKPLRSYEKRLQVINDPSMNTYLFSGDQQIVDNDKSNEFDSNFSSTSKTTTTTTVVPIINSSSQMLVRNLEKQSKKFLIFPTRETFVSKFNDLVINQPENEESQKFRKLVTETSSVESNNHNDDSDNEVTKIPKINSVTTGTSDEPEWNRSINKIVNEIATTTSTTKSTVTAKIDSTSTTKSMSFPTRPSRVNPAIKLAATNPGGGRRSYQSSSKCSSDNSLQQNPKCNEIKYQRPSNTRGRGSAHYTLSGEPPQQSQQSQQPNRGTPPTRSRPTLKPSTVIVTNSNPIVDIYTHPPRRPAPVYPQPTPDKTAAKCRKDVCLLPDCYCGGKDTPGDLPVESVPQIVLLTFDDSVNDLNKGLYADLFEKGRVNPNGCPISATFYVSHEWTDYSQVQNLYAAGHEMASHTISHSFGEQFSQKKWNREVAGQREILAAYGGVKLEDVRGMRAPFLSVGGNKMFKMLYDSNFTYDSSMPVYENRPPSWPYTLDYKLFHDCMIPPCPTKSYPGVWEVPMVMWQDLNGGRCSMGDACANPPEAEGVYKMLLKNFDRHYTTNRAPFGLFYHAAWFTQPHHKEGFIMFLDFINQMNDVWIVTNWQALQWVRDPTPISRLNNFQPFQCNYQDRPKKCNNPKVCNLWHKSGVRYMRTCQPCPEIYPWTGKTGIKSSRIDNDIEE